jgi:UV DNA damage endonuclease
MIKKTWQEKGIAYASQLALANLRDLLKILEWNKQNDIKIYRMSSDIFPWMSEYKISDLPDFYEIAAIASKVGKYVKENDMRISFHPGQFDVLASPNENVVEKTIYDLDQHSNIMNLIGLPRDYSSPINIHIGGSYGDKESALARFCENFSRLAPHTQARLVVENDDKASQFSVKDLYHGVYRVIGCPITFDHLHHRFCTGDLSAHEAAHLAASTWHGFTPLQHYSSSKALYEDSSVINRSHADYIYEKIPSYGLTVDVEIESKAKDLSVLRYRESNELLDQPIPFSFEKTENLDLV